MSSQPVVVLVEDDDAIADLVELYLRRDGYQVHRSGTGEDGLGVIRARRPDLVILDVGLPGRLDGLDVCREVRRHSDVPIIMLTARDGELDRVLGLEIGADDYVVKPFSPRELVARVKVILRRVAPARPDGGTAGAPGPGAPPPPPVLAVGAAIEVDLGRREARVGGHPVALATREFDLLAYLATNRGLALSRRQLLDGVWGDGWIGDERTVDVHVRQLRKKLGDGFALTTVWGIGYRLD
ncbi:MAG: response regulator transcription factor [Acidimicrobiia bacterium]